MNRKQIVGDLLAKADKYRNLARWVTDRLTIQRIFALTRVTRSPSRVSPRPSSTLW